MVLRSSKSDGWSTIRLAISVVVREHTEYNPSFAGGFGSSGYTVVGEPWVIIQLAGFLDAGRDQIESERGCHMRCGV